MFRKYIIIFITMLLYAPFTYADEVPFGKLPVNVSPTHYRLDLEIIPKRNRFLGRVEIDVNLEVETNLIWIHGYKLDVTNAYIKTHAGRVIEATYSEIEDEGIAKLTTKETISAGKVTLALQYSAPFQESYKGLYNVKNDDGAFAYTQLQASRARSVFPGFDEPRFKTPFDISVTIEETDIAISNAPEQSVESIGNGTKKVTFQTTKPLPTYLLAFAIGDFDVVEWDDIAANTIRSWPIPLRGIAPKGKGKQMRYALENTQALVKVFEEYFEIPYPYQKLDIVSPVEFKSGAMENAGAIFYNQKSILLDDNPSIYQLRSFVSIHAHELAHNWFGNLVTPEWWDDLWLNEAFATWIANKVVHQWQPNIYDNHGPTREGKRAMWDDRLVGARQIRQPILKNEDIRNAFDSITYSKGSAMLSMVENYMGADEFRSGVQLFMRQHRHGVATVDDFFRALERITNDPHVPASFKSFLEQPGTPLVSQSWSCDDANETSVLLTQKRSFPLGSKGNPNQTWTIPVCLAYSESGIQKKQCLVMNKKSMEINLPTKSCPVWVHPNAGGAAYLHFTMPSEDWDTLISRIPSLPSNEALTVLHSVEAAYEAGTLTTTQLLTAAKEAVKSSHWDVVRALMQPIKNLKLFIVPNDMQPNLRKVMREIYRPVLNRFDLNDEALRYSEQTTDLALLRSEVIWFMAFDAQDNNLRDTLSRLGQAYVGYNGGGNFNKDIIHPNLVRAALTVATQEVGLGFANILIEKFRTSDDEILRTHIIRALAYQSTPELVERVWELILDPETSKPNAGQFLIQQSRIVANQERIFTWIVDNYDEILNRIPKSHGRWMPWRARSFCNTESGVRVKEFFEDRMKEHDGGQKELQKVLEYTEVCSAIVNAQRQKAIDGVRAYQ